MNLPIIPGQKAKGINGANVVMVPLNTGKNTSPAAFLAATLISSFPLSKIRWVFSITTMASSTTIPKANKNANNTIIFILKPMVGINIKAINMDKGTESATNKAFVTPIKNIRINVTKIKPIMIVLIKSCNVNFVLSD